MVALTGGGPASHPVPDLPLNPMDRVFNLIANRFVGGGPVRLFWLDDSSSYLDGRGSTEHFVSPIEDLLPSIGDSGLTVYPVLLSTGLDKASRKQSEWAAEMLGSRVRLVRGEPGILSCARFANRSSGRY